MTKGTFAHLLATLEARAKVAHTAQSRAIACRESLREDHFSNFSNFSRGSTHEPAPRARMRVI